MPRQQTPVKTWIIAVLAVLVIGQAGYFLFVLPEQERSHIAEIEQQVQQQSAVPPLAREASDPPQSSQNTAPAAVSAPAPADAQASVEQLRQQQQLRDGIGFSHVLRTEIAVFLAEHGRLPVDIGELAIDGLTPPPAVAKAEIGAGGRIVLHFAADGLKGSVSLIPDIDVAAGFVRGWDCSTSDFPFIAKAAPECRYFPR